MPFGCAFWIMGTGTVIVLTACPIARPRASYKPVGLFFRIAGGFEQNCLCVHRRRPLSISPIVRAGKPKSSQLACAPKDDKCQQQPGVGAEEVAILGGGGGGNSGIISACFVGLLTGLCVVLFNNVVHEIRDLCWDGIPSRGASWLRELPHEKMWERIILIPTCGGLVVSLLNIFQSALDVPEERNSADSSSLKAVLKPVFKAVAAAVTLGTGNSLGPEGPSVEIGTSVAKGIGSVFDRDAPQRKLSLKAAGSAAGISSGFNAAVAGCFFAVESVLWPSPAESSLSLTNTTSTVILSAVIASVVSEIGLGSEPAFRVPDYDFRSPNAIKEGCVKKKRKSGSKGKGKAPAAAPKPKGKEPETSAPKAKPEDATCYHCGEKGHWRNNCRKFLEELKKLKAKGVGPLGAKGK